MKFILLIMLFPHILFASNAELFISEKIKDKTAFVSNIGPGPWSSYLVMNIPFAPVQQLFYDLDLKLKGILNKEGARTEAHITVITPVEYHEVLRSHISIEEIHQIAQNHRIQQSEFDIICLGMGSALVKEKIEKTFYIVVQAPKLLQIREKIFKLFKMRGGDPDLFAPHLFYPHITVGYTNQDLHLESHGVKKDVNSCFQKLVISKTR